MQREKLSIVCQLNFGNVFYKVEAESKRHIAVFVVVTIGLTIGRDMRQLRFFTQIIEAADQPVGKFSPVIQQSVERDTLRYITIIKE
jgi:hypothetical protein